MFVSEAGTNIGLTNRAPSESSVRVASSITGTPATAALPTIPAMSPAFAAPSADSPRLAAPSADSPRLAAPSAGPLVSSEAPAVVAYELPERRSHRHRRREGGEGGG